MTNKGVTYRADLVNLRRLSAPSSLLLLLIGIQALHYCNCPIGTRNSLPVPSARVLKAAN